MNQSRSPLFRLFVAAVLIALIFSMPAREFMKVTFIIGIPFIFLLGQMVKKPRYSMSWILFFVGLLLTAGAYVYLLTQLPERIEVRRITTEGGSLVAEGKFDEAIAEYKKLEKLGKTQKMNEKIEIAEKEKEGAKLLQEARDLIAKGETAKAVKLLDDIPKGTRASVESDRLRKSLKS